VLAAMDLLQVACHRRGGGDDRLLAWEFSAGLTDWEQAPLPPASASGWLKESSSVGSYPSGPGWSTT
jgi:hypothetical protein